MSGILEFVKMLAFLVLVYIGIPCVIGMIWVIVCCTPTYLCMKLWELAMEFAVDPLFRFINKCPVLGKLVTICVTAVMGITSAALVVVCFMVPPYFLVCLAVSGGGAISTSEKTGLIKLGTELFNVLIYATNPMKILDFDGTAPCIDNPIIVIIKTLALTPFLSAVVYFPFWWILKIIKWMFTSIFFSNE